MVGESTQKIRSFVNKTLKNHIVDLWKQVAMELPGVVRAQPPHHDARPLLRKENYKIMYPLDEQTLAVPQSLYDLWKDTKFKDELDEIIKKHNERYNLKGVIHKGSKRGADAIEEVITEETAAKIEHKEGDPTTAAEIDEKYPGAVKVQCGVASAKWTAVFAKSSDNAQLFLMGEDVVVPSGVPLCGVGSGTWKSDQEAKEIFENPGPGVCVCGWLLVL